MIKALAIAVLAVMSSAAPAAMQTYSFTGKAAFGTFGLPMPAATRGFSGTLSFDPNAPLWFRDSTVAFFEPAFTFDISFDTGETGSFTAGFGNISIQRHAGQAPSLRFTRGGVFADDPTANLTLEILGSTSSWSDLALPAALDDFKPQSNFVSITYGGLSMEERRKEVFGRLDTLGVAAVPEPASWALMICGFAMTGAAVRKRPAATAPVRARA